MVVRRPCETKASDDGRRGAYHNGGTDGGDDAEGEKDLDGHRHARLLGGWLLRGLNVGHGFNGGSRGLVDDLDVRRVVVGRGC